RAVGVGEKATDALAQHALVLRVARPVHRVRIHALAAMVVPPDLEPGIVVVREAVERSAGDGEIEDGEDAHLEALGAERPRPEHPPAPPASPPPLRAAPATRPPRPPRAPGATRGARRRRCGPGRRCPRRPSRARARPSGYRRRVHARARRAARCTLPA